MFAIWVAAKAKNKNMKVPTNSPVMAMKCAWMVSDLDVLWSWLLAA